MRGGAIGAWCGVREMFRNSNERKEMSVKKLKKLSVLNVQVPMMYS